MDFTGGKILVRLTTPVGGLNYNVGNDVDYIEVNTSSGGITNIYLQKISIADARKTVYISDVGNNASVGNIRIHATGGNVVNNATFITLSVNGIVAEVNIADTNRFIANLSTDDTTVTTNGHTIQDNGVSLPQRQNLNFVGGNVTDDPINNSTNVDLAIDKNFVIQQVAPALVWSVPHNLNKKCSVQITDNSLNEIEGGIRWVNNNEVEITFNSPKTGWVYCN